MKNIQFIFAALLATVLMSRCDYVTPKKSTVIKDTSSITYVQNILVEDYSGHKCGNCPYAAYELDTLISTYGSRIIPINIQAGFDAVVDLTGFYTTDYRTPVGNAWDQFFNVDNYGYPAGMINRLGYPNSNLQPYTAWQVLIANSLQMAPPMNISISNSFTSSTRSLTTTITSTYLQALDSTYMICAVITEDSIYNNQLEYYPPQTGNITNISNFQFNHMLRTSFNGNWGDTLSTGQYPINATFPKTYTIILDTAFKATHCNVVTFIYNSATYQVVQAQMARVTQ